MYHLLLMIWCRFSKDIDTIDVNIPLTLRIWLGTFAACISTLVVITYSTPIFLVVMLPLAVFYYFVQVRIQRRACC